MKIAIGVGEDTNGKTKDGRQCLIRRSSQVRLHLRQQLPHVGKYGAHPCAPHSASPGTLRVHWQGRVHWIGYTGEPQAHEGSLSHE